MADGCDSAASSDTSTNNHRCSDTFTSSLQQEHVRGLCSPQPSAASSDNGLCCPQPSAASSDTAPSLPHQWVAHEAGTHVRLHCTRLCRTTRNRACGQRLVRGQRLVCKQPRSWRGWRSVPPLPLTGCVGAGCAATACAVHIASLCSPCSTWTRLASQTRPTCFEEVGADALGVHVGLLQNHAAASDGRWQSSNKGGKAQGMHAATVPIMTWRRRSSHTQLLSY